MAFLKLKPTLTGHVRKAIFALGGQEGEDAFKKRTKHFPAVIERYSPTEARSLLGVFLSWASLFLHFPFHILLLSLFILSRGRQAFLLPPSPVASLPSSPPEGGQRSYSPGGEDEEEGKREGTGWMVVKIAFFLCHAGLPPLPLFFSSHVCEGDT